MCLSDIAHNRYVSEVNASLDTGYISNKNAFQWDAYRPLVDRIPACTVQGGVYPSMHWAGGCVSQHALGRRGCVLMLVQSEIIL